MKERESELIFVSRVGLSSLEEELQNLREERTRLEGEMGAAARADPDLRENPEFMGLRTYLHTVMPRRIGEVIGKISRSVVIEDQPFHQEAGLDEVFIGARVTLVEENGETYLLTILGPTEVNLDEGIISYLSPLGSVLLGKKVGDNVIVDAESGLWQVRVEGIEKGL